MKTVIKKLKKHFPEIARVLEDNKETIHKTIELVEKEYKDFHMAFPLSLLKSKEILRCLMKNERRRSNEGTEKAKREKRTY